MRHFYKSHGKHCYLRSFQTKCPKCDADVLYWECKHGSKVFFDYPPYGKLMKHFCRHRTSILTPKRYSPIIVKKPKGLLEISSPSCPVCGKLFKNEGNLKDHLKNLRKNDKLHNSFFENKLFFKDNYRKKGQINLDQIKMHYKPKFGRINVKKKEID